MLCAPHHAQSIPARAARGNHGAKLFECDYSQRHKLTPHALTCARAPPYSGLGGFVAQALLPLRLRECLRKRAQSRVAVLETAET